MLPPPARFFPRICSARVAVGDARRRPTGRGVVDRRVGREDVLPLLEHVVVAVGLVQILAEAVARHQVLDLEPVTKIAELFFHAGSFGPWSPIDKYTQKSKC